MTYEMLSLQLKLTHTTTFYINKTTIFKQYFAQNHCKNAQVDIQSITKW